MALRFSSSKFDKAGMVVLKNGFVQVPANFTRTGVFKYRRADGSVALELRHPDDVFDPESIASLQMAPLTDDHPPEMVNPDNVSQYSTGWLGNDVQVKDNKFLSGTLVIANKKAIAKANSGKVELSGGYHADVIEESGEFEGEKYNFRQKNIRYNHVAQVTNGRAGKSVRMKLDADDAEEITDENEPFKEEQIMEKVKIDGTDYEVSADLALKIRGLQARGDSGSDALKAIQTKLDQASADLVAEKSNSTKLQAKIDGLEQKLSEKKDAVDAKDIGKAVTARLSIEKTAGAVLGADAKFDGKTDKEIKQEVVKKVSPATAEEKLKNDDYLDARFDSISEEYAGREVRKTQLSGLNKNDTRKDADFDSRTKRDAAHNESKDAWKQGLDEK